MVVIAHDPYASEEKARALGVQLVSFDDALARVRRRGRCPGRGAGAAAARAPA
jgi:hypothetical protein